MHAVLLCLVCCCYMWEWISYVFYGSLTGSQWCRWRYMFNTHMDVFYSAFSNTTTTTTQKTTTTTNTITTTTAAAVTITMRSWTGVRFNINMSNIKILRPSYIHNGISYSGQAYLYFVQAPMIWFMKTRNKSFDALNLFTYQAYQWFESGIPSAQCSACCRQEPTAALLAHSQS